MRSACVILMIVAAILLAWISVEPRLQASWDCEPDDAKADLFAARFIALWALTLAFVAGKLI